MGFAVANSIENTCFQSQETAHTNSVVLRDFTALLEILIPERHPVRNMGEDLFALHLETPVGSLISRLVPSELSLLLLARASDTVVIGVQHWRPRKRTTFWECVLSYGKKVLPCVQATTLWVYFPLHQRMLRFMSKRGSGFQHIRLPQI